MNRRDFLGLSAGVGLLVFAPRFGRWFRPNRIWVPELIDMPVQVAWDPGVVARAEGSYLPMPPPPITMSIRIDKALIERLRPQMGALEHYLRGEVKRQLGSPSGPPNRLVAILEDGSVRAWHHA